MISKAKFKFSTYEKKIYTFMVDLPKMKYYNTYK